MRAAPTEEGCRLNQPRIVLGTIVLVLATFVAYLPALRGGFVWDDDFHVTENRSLRSARGLLRIWTDPSTTPQYYPLTHTTFWIEYRIWGLLPFGYHLTNVLLHAASAVVLWSILRALEARGAWLAAALFALHPVHVESVAWITERKNTLSGMLALASALVYLRHVGTPGPSGRPYVTAFLLFLGALLSKTVTLTLPLSLGLVLWWKRGRLLRGDVVRLAPMLAVGVLLGGVTAWLERHQVGAAGEEWSLTLAERFLVAGRAVWFYLGKLLWPAPLTFIYPRWALDPRSVLAWCFPVAAAAALVLLWRLRGRLGVAPLVAALYFVITLSPALGFFDVYPMRYSFVADHFQYLASIGPIALFAAACEGLPLAALLLVALAALTWSRGHAFRDQDTLWRDTLAKNPGAWMAHNNLASLLASEGKLDEAIAHFQEAVRLKPDHAKAHDSLGVALVRAGRTREAVEAFVRAVQLSPDDAGMRTNLAEALVLSGRGDEGLEEFDRALGLAPADAQVHARLGSALAQLGRNDEARAQLEEALRIAPRDANAQYNLGTLLLRTGRYEEAAAHLEEALRLDPRFEKARRNLEAARRAR